MKKVLLILSVFVFFCGYAQVNTKGTKQLMFSIFTSDAQLVYKKYIKDGFALRYSIRGNYKYNKDFDYKNVEKNTGSTNNNFSSQLNISLGFGFQKSIIKIDDKVDVYLGCDFFLGNKFYKQTSERIVTDSLTADRYYFSNSQNGDYNRGSTTTPLTVTLDAVPFAGFKYFFHPRLAFGAECRMSLINVFFNPVTAQSLETVKRGIYTKKDFNSSSAYKTGIGFDLNTAANITITLLLNKPAVVEKKIEN